MMEIQQVPPIWDRPSVLRAHAPCPCVLYRGSGGVSSVTQPRPLVTHNTRVYRVHTGFCLQVVVRNSRESREHVRLGLFQCHHKVISF